MGRYQHVRHERSTIVTSLTDSIMQDYDRVLYVYGVHPVGQPTRRRELQRVVQSLFDLPLLRSVSVLKPTFFSRVLTTFMLQRWDQSYSLHRLCIIPATQAYRTMKLRALSPSFLTVICCSPMTLFQACQEYCTFSDVLIRYPAPFFLAP